jgi:hypothetical protein
MRWTTPTVIHALQCRCYIHLSRYPAVGASGTADATAARAKRNARDIVGARGFYAARLHRNIRPAIEINLRVAYTPSGDSVELEAWVLSRSDVTREGLERVEPSGRALDSASIT